MLRAWTAVGIAVRSAYSLGLHLRNEDPSASLAKRETLSRKWWSLYSLEHLLSTVTGRPSMIAASPCTAPVPGPIRGAHTASRTEDVYRMGRPSASDVLADGDFIRESSRARYAAPTLELVGSDSTITFAASVRLSIVTQAIVASPYSVTDPTKSLDKVEQDIAGLKWRLDQWIASLPRRLNFEQPADALDTVWKRDRMLLGFQWCSARILLEQPCHYAYVRKRSLPMRYEAQFAYRMSRTCLNAAKAIIDCLPDEPRTDFVYNQCPWWCFVHYLMQAVSIFLLDLSYPRASPQDDTTLIGYVNRTIGWLHVMDDFVAQRAKQTIERLLEPLVGRPIVRTYSV